jgi:hypothetical protein
MALEPKLMLGSSSPHLFNLIQITHCIKNTLQLDKTVGSNGIVRICGEPGSPTRFKEGVISVLGLLGALILGLSVSREARAHSGNSFLETIGFTTAVGTVLGASTLPFYDQPGQHLENLAYGASLGAIAGLGVYLYQALSGDSHSGLFASETRSCKPLDSSLSIDKAGNANLISESRTDFSRSGPPAVSVGMSARPTQFWMPLVSLTW